ncbi:hypothetical protein AB5N19_03992 [Seiridium cardinale]
MSNPLNLNPKLFDAFQILSYAPVALFAESLRVSNEIIHSVASRSLCISCLTGSIKDLNRLWHFKQRELFGELLTEHKWTVSSLRHGNTFTLANRRLLKLAGIIGRPPQYDAALEEEDYVRPTTVNITFITPRDVGTSLPSKPYESVWYYRVTTMVQLLAHTSIAVGLGWLGLVSSSLLVTCIVASHITLVILRMAVVPVFANRSAIAKDSQIKASGGAALDVHVNTSDWNSDSIDVICGYSSQLHSLTNIPVRLKNYHFATWAFRILALILIVQAATLASLLGCGTGDVLGPGIWLTLYLAMRLVSGMARTRHQTTTVLDLQPADVSATSSLTFKRRRTALLLIASLPCSEKAGKWCWLDPFMPDNPRRREWQARYEQVREGTRYGHAGSNAIDQPSEMQALVSEIDKALGSQPLHSCLESYKPAVGCCHEEASNN